MWGPKKRMQEEAGRPCAKALENPTQEDFRGQGWSLLALAVWLSLGAAQPAGGATSPVSPSRTQGPEGVGRPDPSLAPPLTSWVTLGLKLLSLGFSIYLGNAAGKLDGA